MSPGQIVLILYALLMLAGGIVGFRKASSKASLYAGSASALLLLLAWLVSTSSLAAGLWLGAIVAILLSIVFAMRLAKTTKFMPSGMLLVVSVVALVLLTWSALGAQGKL